MTVLLHGVKYYILLNLGGERSTKSWKVYIFDKLGGSVTNQLPAVKVKVKVNVSHEKQTNGGGVGGGFFLDPFPHIILC